MDISKAIQANSCQLNADDLVGGSIVVMITDVKKGNAEQPVVIEITGGHQPWKPSKTSLRGLAAAWGVNTASWVGQVVELYNEPTVRWAGKPVGGIRVKAISGIDSKIEIMVSMARGKKVPLAMNTLKKVESAEDFNALDADDKRKHWNYLSDELKNIIKESAK